MNINQPTRGRAFAIPFNKAANPTSELTDTELRLPFLAKLPDSFRNHFVAMCGEYVGTVLFLWFALFGTQVANSIPSTGGQTVAQLVFTIFMLAAEKHKGTFIAPVGIGLALFIAELTGVYFTGGSLNPACSFGPAVVNHSFNHYHWIYWLGPILGAIVAAGFYKFIKILEYETANPGQDNDHAATVERRRNLLLAAGINEYDAHKAAQELTEKGTVNRAGGPNGSILANGQGRRTNDPDQQGMYGTQPRPLNTPQAPLRRLIYHLPAAPAPAARHHGEPARPLQLPGRAGCWARQRCACGLTSDGPAMSTNDQLYAPLAHGADVPLGGSVHPDIEPRQRVVRTASGYA
ncbi:hypothetical protein EJ07DRAFT_169298 [Lizonia empirigonia]|nr:hypothetical protein EJ07DRAFT_169298 [Lizonia empirigonia]